MLLKWFQKYIYVIALSIVLICSNTNSQNSIRSLSGSHNQGPLSTNLNPPQSSTLSKSEPGFHSSGPRGNYEGPGVFSKNNKNENFSADQNRATSYVTPNVKELLETLQTKISKRRFNNTNLHVPLL